MLKIHFLEKSVSQDYDQYCILSGTEDMWFAKYKISKVSPMHKVWYSNSKWGVRWS